MALIEHACRKPLVDQPNEPAIADPMFNEPDQPFMTHRVDERPDVGIESPVDPAPANPERERVQCIMLTAPASSVQQSPHIQQAKPGQHTFFLWALLSHTIGQAFQLTCCIFW